MTLVPPGSGEPEISVVMVTHGAWPLTERAVEALRSYTDCPFELIVVDNDSRDQTRARLSELPGVTVVLNERNEGFGPASNRGAARARAEQLVLLNTDAFVSPGWLGPLRENLRQPGVGAVTPRLLHPDGSLQDAGPLLAQDGTVLVYGDGGDAEDARYRFRRVVDYGGAACMLIRRDLFEELGGFDPRYLPAYYEDADLGLRIAERGMRIVYEPRSTVTHVRYGSGGAGNAIELSERNRERFVERWGPKLTGRPWTFRGTSEQAVIGARDVRATPRVLLAAHPREPGSAELAQQVLSSWPLARVTWAVRASNGFDSDAWLERGVEVLDGAERSWLEQRLFHYDLVLLGADVPEPTITALAGTQPQAHRASIAELGDGPRSLQSIAVRAGIAPARA